MPPRLQEAGEVRALAQLRDAQLDRAGAGLPVALPVAVALGQPLRVLLAIGRPGQAADLHLHQPLGGKADHLPQQIGVGGLLYERAQVHDLVGHRWFLGSGWCSQPDPTGDPPMTTAKPLARYGAMGRARERLRYRRATPPPGTRPAKALNSQSFQLARDVPSPRGARREERTRGAGHHQSERRNSESVLAIYATVPHRVLFLPTHRMRGSCAPPAPGMPSAARVSVGAARIS